VEKSESIVNLAKAMAAFQGEVKNPANTANNPFYKSKYAPLNEILNDVRPLLSKHGLSVIQSPGGNGKDISISTILMHTSGEWMELEPLTLTAERITPQGAGSAITYGRRYVISALLGIASEDDDDGNSLETTPSGKGRVKCSSCGQEIKGTAKMNVNGVISYSNKKYGKNLCTTCMKKIENQGGKERE